MKTKWWKMGLLYGGVVVIAAVLGTAMGDLGASRREKVHLAEQQKELQDYLKQNVQGIAVGSRFPDFTVWMRDSTTTIQTTALLENGGILFYLLADCQSCLDAVDELHSTREESGPEPAPVALIVSGNPEHLLAHMAESGYDLPLYRDMEDKLLQEHHVTAYPCFFKLDANGVVIDFNAVKSGTGMFADVFVP